MLKNTRNIRSAVNLKEIKGKAGSNSMVDNSIVGSNKTTNQIIPIKKKNQAKTTKSKILIKSKNHDFPLNPEIKRSE